MNWYQSIKGDIVLDDWELSNDGAKLFSNQVNNQLTAAKKCRAKKSSCEVLNVNRERTQEQKNLWCVEDKLHENPANYSLWDIEAAT